MLIAGQNCVDTHWRLLVTQWEEKVTIQLKTQHTKAIQLDLRWSISILDFVGKVVFCKVILFLCVSVSLTFV